LKKRGSEGGELTSGQTLVYAAEASAASAILSNPIWVVKIRMITTHWTDPKSHRGVWHGLSSIYRTEGVRGLYRGTLLALVGVSNGSLQFMAYERVKRFAFKWKRAMFEKAGRPYTLEDDKLANTTYIVASGASKIFALAVTYPYQVTRARIQNNATKHLYPDIPTCIKRTFSESGVRGFYRGLATNFVRVLPGGCVTFVVYENIAWLLRIAAAT
ncbi:mitochondrial carrier domain-containing protein, partial [Thelephora terrestris]